MLSATLATKRLLDQKTVCCFVLKVKCSRCYFAACLLVLWFTGIVAMAVDGVSQPNENKLLHIILLTVLRNTNYQERIQSRLKYETESDVVVINTCFGSKNVAVLNPAKYFLIY